MDRGSAPAVALTVAGSDPSGGAGIQADLKTFHQFGVFGTSAITVVTVQNTVGVRSVHPLDEAVVVAQIHAVAEDLEVAAAKTGALGSARLIEAVAEAVEACRLRNLVVDPVMVSKHGDRLLPEDAVAALRRALFPLAALITPNLHEAAALLGEPVQTARQMGRAARALSELTPGAVLIKGGALPGDEALDVLFDGRELIHLRAPRHQTRSTHGTGCTYSAAITALLARGTPLPAAVQTAKDHITRAIATAPALGTALGPVNHWGGVGPWQPTD